jgi:3',5'-cyclic AMP phosphodiesterase CpdA
MDPLIATADAAAAPPPAPRSTPPTGRLWAIGDIHLSFKANRDALEKLEARPCDGLILCGDVGETMEHCHTAFAAATACFARVWWVPGNHELYTMPSSSEWGARGVAKYMECVSVARSYGILTPEDDFVLWDGEGEQVLICPIFTLYDYSFRPDDIKLEDALAWAREKDVEATDEHLLHPDPYKSRIEWCHALVDSTAAKLDAAKAAHPGVKTILINHWPLRQDVITLPFVPRFSLWCGTKKTRDWHKEYNAKAVISGHLHIRRTDWIDNTRFEECSLGYPRQWKECQERGMDINDLLREVLPGPDSAPEKKATAWRKFG